MAQVLEEKGNILLYGENYDLKIDSNRIIYARKKDQTLFESIGHQVPIGYDREGKKKYLVELYKKLEYRRSQEELTEENVEK